MSDAAQGPMLTMRGIAKRYGAVQALAGVDLEVAPGEVHALIGENGAGKSTLMKVLSGAVAPDAGSITLAGAPYAPHDPLAAHALGVAMVYQELALAAPLTVSDNVFLGRELRRGPFLDRASMRARTAQALRDLGEPDISPDARVSALSPAARQLVEIARALTFEARLVVLDEPTSSLAHGDVERLFAVVERLRARGVSVVYISHFLEEVQRIAQRYTVLRDGRSVASGDIDAREERRAFSARVLAAMAGRALDDAYPRSVRAFGPERLAVREVRVTERAAAASFTLLRGEILGVFGLIGAGRSELLRALFGLDTRASGELRRAGGAWLPVRSTPARRWREGWGIVSENRKDEGLALTMSVADNMTLSRPAARASFLSQRAAHAATNTLAPRLALRFSGPAQRVGELSGGNQQKVALLRLLHHDVEVLLLDEPTRGIDVASKAAIYTLLDELARAGRSVLVVSSYLPELLGICDRIAVMRRGVLSEARPVDAWDERSLLAAATAGSEAPP